MGVRNLRILLLTASMDTGGAETHVFELARAFEKGGDLVTVASSGGRLAQKFLECGIEHVRLPLGSHSPVSLIRARRELKRLLKKGNFDIVHAHSRLAAFLAHEVCMAAEVRMVTTVHAHYRKSLLFDRLAKWGSGVIAVSYDLYRYIQRNGRGVPIEQLRVIPNGVDTCRFLPTERKGTTIKIAFLSRLDSDCSKAAFSLCRIAEQLASRYQGIRVEIGGGGSEYRSLEKLARQVNSRFGREVVRAVGRVDDTALFLSDADIFVGVSRAALEAMSCAVPVVLAGDEGFLGVLDTQKIPLAESTNFCCRGGAELSDTQLLAAISLLADMSNDGRKALGNKLRDYVKSTHSVELMAERTKQFYGAVCSVKKRRGGVLLCGYYGFGNMGDDLLLLSSAKRARQKKSNIALCALTKGGARDSDKFSLRCASRKNIFSILREIKKADTVVFGGGTLLQNDTSARSLAYYLFILRCAKAFGKKTELWGNGIGDIKGRAFRRTVAKAIEACSYVGVRDKRSFSRVAELLSEFGRVAPPVVLERDLASGYLDGKYDTGEMLIRELGLAESRRFAVVIVRGGEYERVVRALDAWLRSLRASAVKLVFVAMYPKQDIQMCRSMSEAHEGVLAYPISLAELFGLIGRAYAVCSMRYHGLVLASDAGTPFFGFGSDDKIKSFCEENGGVYWTQGPMNAKNTATHSRRWGNSEMR